MSAVLFGSIGALADTSEVQRKAFNEAFRAHQLDWNWSREEYRQLLQSSGGKDRIAAYAQSRGQDVDAAAVHQTKTEIFQKRLQEDGISPRPGVVQTISEARRDGAQVALVTTTSPDNVTALSEALRPQVDIGAFALVVDTTSVEHPKPAPDAYRYALAHSASRPSTASRWRTTSAVCRPRWRPACRASRFRARTTPDTISIRRRERSRV